MAQFQRRSKFGPPMRTPECGHPKTRHAGHGLCRNCYARRRYKDNPKRGREISLRWYYRHPLQAGQHNRRRVLKRYGLTPKGYDALLARQNYRCGICEVAKASNKRGEKLAVDHDHTAKKVRGLLCSNCNNGLGRFKDSIILLENAVRYLRGHK